MDSLDSLSADDERLVAQFLQEAFVKKVIIVQRDVRRFLARCRIHEYIAAKYEKIYDPKNRCYYYYNIESDKSSWKKPILLRQSDITFISPTYSLDEAAYRIQRQARRRAALKRVRMLYKTIVTEATDISSGLVYYYNKNSETSMWKLPNFMGGIFDHKYKEAKKIKKPATAGELEEKEEKDDDDDEEEEAEESSDESVASEDSEAVRQRRILARKYPRYLAVT
jgi:hypothetical protein